MSKLKSFRDLLIWQKSMSLVENVYAATKNFPKEEVYGLSSQMRRSAISIPSNISEGHGRNTDGEFKQFLGIANGSLFELETQIELSMRLGYLARESNLLEKCSELGKMLNGLMKSLRS